MYLFISYIRCGYVNKRDVRRLDVIGQRNTESFSIRTNLYVGGPTVLSTKMCIIYVVQTQSFLTPVNSKYLHFRYIKS